MSKLRRKSSIISIASSNLSFISNHICPPIRIQHLKPLKDEFPFFVLLAMVLCRFLGLQNNTR
uniref:Protein yippee-like n=1 Tax=Rhizophora mucronata TaxID=61149 RepID=A0A2P2K719_RHIMU